MNAEDNVPGLDLFPGHNFLAVHSSDGKSGHVILRRKRRFLVGIKSRHDGCLAAHKRAAGLATGSAQPNRDKVGKVTAQQVLEIVRTKMNDLNATDEAHAVRMIEGTARSMGIEVVR